MSRLRDAAVWLFCPGDRPDRYVRALDSSEVVIIDLEDAVAAEDKDTARAALLAAAQTLDPARVIVRINATDTHDGEEDVAALRGTGLRTVMVPKVIGAEQLERLDGFDAVALCETAAAIQASGQIAAARNCIAITWGGQDLALDFAAVATRDADGQLLPFASHARNSVRYAAAAAGLPAYDTVWIDIEDVDGLVTEARAAADQGFAGKMVIHPRHVAPVRDAFMPTEEQVASAERIVLAARTSRDGTIAADGRMLDRPVVEQAQMTLDRAARGVRSSAG